MATSPTKADLAGQILERLIALEKGVEAFQAVTEHRLKYLEATFSEYGKTVAELREQQASQEARLKALEKLADHPAALASHDQRLKALEKGTDRTWQFAAMAISVLAVIVSVIVAFVKK